MTKLPLWCWLVALVPGLVCVALAVQFVTVHFPAGSKSRGTGADPLVLAFAVYVAFVLLGYLILVTFRPQRHDEPEP